MTRKPKAIVEDTEVAEVKPKAIKHPIPDGWDTPSEFALYASHNGLHDGSDAQIYNHAKFAFPSEILDKDGNPRLDEDGNRKMRESNGFPVKIHTDGRTIIDREAAVTWLQGYKIHQAQRKATAQERTAIRTQAVVLAVARYTLGRASLAEANRELAQAKSN